MNLISKLKLILRFKFWASLRINHFPSFNSSHSQFGEDMLLNSILGNKKDGFYIDIGAHHPVYFSNTYHFYRKGWRGINIDAAPGSMKDFKLLRPRDINLEVCIAPENNLDVEFYTFEKAALNTFDEKMAQKALTSDAKLIKKVNLKTVTLEHCLTKYLLPGQEIDFLSIDVEGLDEMILKSNNWLKFSPKIVVFESHEIDLKNFSNEGLVKFLNSHNYEIIGKCGPSFFAQRKT